MNKKIVSVMTGIALLATSGGVVGITANQANALESGQVATQTNVESTPY